MTSWGYPTLEVPCGFVGCAVGWAIHKNIVPGLSHDWTHGPKFYLGDGLFSYGYDAAALDKEQRNRNLLSKCSTNWIEVQDFLKDL